ncbi:MAG: nucleotidyl transferase AbiEii/AbiGii toxin family protein [Kineosporiaceae bacterium]|nr:nucleotidyl transferase AbiEii/AbiGii toxin family protein [Kineosporiaceae bacterium]
MTAAGRAYLDLKAKAQKESRLTDELIQLYVLEGFLARLAMSAHADKLVLKGGVLLAAFDTRRPTRDIDFAARDLTNDTEHILDVARAILAVTQKDDDGLVFDPRSAVAEVIRDEEEYSGVRVSMNAELATARVRFHLDVNVGDPVWPAPSRVSMPRPLGGQPLEPMGYPLHMVHAEKTVADLACIDAGGSREQRIGSGSEEVYHHRLKWYTPSCPRRDLATRSQRPTSSLPRWTRPRCAGQG